MNESVGQCNADCGSFFHIGVQHGHSPGVVLTHRYVYVGLIQPIRSDLCRGKEDGALCGVVCHEACGAALAVYVQVFQRRVHAPRVTDCKRLNLVIRYMKGYKCGLNIVCLKRPLKLVGFIDAGFKAQPDEPTGFALRGGAAISHGDPPENDQPHSVGG